MTLGNILVTGGAGFIGSQLVKHLIPLSQHIYVIDDLSTGEITAIPDSPKITFIEDSILNKLLLQKILPKVEYIFHLACSNLLQSVTFLEKDFNTNLLGGFTLLESAQSHCPNLKRFVYTSTTSIYSEADILPTPENYHKVRLPYAASKFSMEHYCQVFYHLYQLPISVLRLSNVYGPGQSISNPYCGVIAQFFEAAKNKTPFIIYGDGQQTRDFTYIEDTLEAILLTLDNHRAIGRVYNVGTGIETSILELAQEIMEITDFSEGTIDFKAKRLVDIVARRKIDATKIEKELRWKASTTLSQGLKHTLQWLKE